MKGDTCNARGDLKFGSSMKIEWKLCFFFRFLSYNCEKDRENALLRWRKMLGAREMLVNFVALPDLNYDDVSLEGAMGTSLRRCSWSGKNSYQSLLCQHMCLAYRAPSPRAWGWVLVDCGFTMVCVCVFWCFLLFYFFHGRHGVANALKICRQHWGESCEDEPSEDRVAGSPMSQGSCVEWLNVSCAKYVE